MEAEQPGPEGPATRRVADGRLERDAHSPRAVRGPQDAETVHAGEDGRVRPVDEVYRTFSRILFLCHHRTGVLMEINISDLEYTEENSVVGRQFVAV